MFSMMAMMNGQHEDVFKNRDHARREHFVQCVDVSGHARHQPAHRILVEERDVHMLQVAEDLATQVEHHLLPGPLHQVGLHEFQREGEKQQPNVEAADLGDTHSEACRSAGRRSRNANSATSPDTCRWQFW